MAKKKYKLEEGGYYPDGVIRQPEPSESVSRKEIDATAKICMYSERNSSEGVIPQISVPVFDWQSICNHPKFDYYARCPHYNTVFCRGECSFGIKDTPVLKTDYNTEQGVVLTKMDDVNLDYTQEDGK